MKARSANAKNMVYSLLVVLAMVAAWAFAMPRSEQAARNPVEVAAPAAFAAEQVTWPVLLPETLPQGWDATSVVFEDLPREQGKVWRVGYLTDTDAYISLEQAVGDEQWLDGLTGGGDPERTVTISGQEWHAYVDGQGDKVLVRPGSEGQATTVLSGTAEFEVLSRIAETLRPVAVTPRSAAPSASPTSPGTAQASVS